MRRVITSATALMTTAATVWTLIGFAPKPATDTASVLAQTPGVANATQSFSVTTDGSLVSDLATVPAQPKDGVKIGDGKDAFTVELPIEGVSVSRLITPAGSVIYDTKGSSDDAVIPTGNGAQFLKVLNDRKAPDSFTYPVNLSQGSRIALSTSPDNYSPSGKQAPGAVVLNDSGQIVAFIDAPWAKDAKKKPVKTYFTTDGSNLTQHVDLNQKDITFPVVADPYFRWYANGVVITFTYDDEVAIAGGGITVMAGLVGSSIWTLIGPLVIAGTLGPIVADASWSVATRQCLWIWYPYPVIRGFDLPDRGYYKC